MGKKLSKQKNKERHSKCEFYAAVHEYEVLNEVEPPEANDEDGTVSLRHILPQEIWSHIFSYLSIVNLLSVQQASNQWKELVCQHLRSSDRLTKECHKLDDMQPLLVLKILRQFGWSLRELALLDTGKYHKHGNLLVVIGIYRRGCDYKMPYGTCGTSLFVTRLKSPIIYSDGCPNLVKLVLIGERTLCDTGLRHLALKCDKLEDISFFGLNYYTDKGFGFVLKSLQQLKRLRLHAQFGLFGTCFDHLGPKLESITLDYIDNMPSSTFVKLLSNIGNEFQGSHLHFERFGEVCDNPREISLNRIVDNNEKHIKISRINGLYMPGHGFEDDDKLAYTLHKFSNDDLYSSVVIHTGHAFGQITDIGVKKIVNFFQEMLELDISGNDKITDTSLEYLANYGLLKILAVRRCKLISERGCIDLVSRCPRLELLDIRGCSQMTDAILQPSSMAVQNRSDGLQLKLKERPSLILICGIYNVLVLKWILRQFDWNSNIERAED